MKIDSKTETCGMNQHVFVVVSLNEVCNLPAFSSLSPCASDLPRGSHTIGHQWSKRFTGKKKKKGY